MTTGSGPVYKPGADPNNPRIDRSGSFWNETVQAHAKRRGTEARCAWCGETTGLRFIRNGHLRVIAALWYECGNTMNCEQRQYERLGV